MTRFIECSQHSCGLKNDADEGGLADAACRHTHLMHLRVESVQLMPLDPVINKIFVVQGVIIDKPGDAAAVGNIQAVNLSFIGKGMQLTEAGFGQQILAGDRTQSGRFAQALRI